MNLAPLEQINKLASANQNQPNQEALRQAARQFEAILLMQLTSALNGAGESGGDDEDSLFGGDGGTEMAKKMFSEQLATTMSDSGGVGLADLIMQKFGVDAKAATGKNNALTKTISAVREIRGNAAVKQFAAPPVDDNYLIDNTYAPEKRDAPQIYKNGKITPVGGANFNNPGEVEIISTFEDEARAEGLEESQRHLILDGKLVNSTRARIVPTAPVTEIRTEIPVKSFPASGNVDYEMPVKGRVSSNFGMRFHPIDKVVKFHAGLDIAVPVGTPVGASADGVVTFAGNKSGYGNVVIVRHADGRETRYGHLSRIIVAENERVAGGQQIALSGTTGKSTGPHLHFEVRENGEAVNPLKFVSKVLR